MKLSSLVVAAVAVAMTASPASAQRREMEGGIQGGATYSKLSGDFFTTSDWRWGGMFGGYFEGDLHPLISGRVEFNWLQKGGKGIPQPTAVPLAQQGEEVDIKLNYVEIPLILGLNVPIGRRKLSLYGGIAWGFETACSISVAGASRTACVAGLVPVIPKSSEWSIPFGASLGLATGRADVSLDVRYSIGLSQAFELEDARNRTWEFLLRIGFPTR